MRPVLIVNAKAKKEGVGRNALKLAKAAESAVKKTGKRIIIAFQPSDIWMVTRNCKIPVFAQHVDPVDFGSHTGHILPEAVKKAGASGTLISHAERRLDLGTILKTVKKCRSVGLTSVVCVPDMKNVRKIAEAGPDYIAFEDPKLIGTLKSISQLEPKSVEDFAKMVRKANPKVVPLCGAGVASRDDVKAALRLGTPGVLVATAVVKAKNQEKAMEDLVGGFG